MGKLGQLEDAEEQGLHCKESNSECASCNETFFELPVLAIAKYTEDIIEMAKENWCESHIIMLRRLILAVQQGTRYDETLLPEEEAEQALKKLESEEK